MADDPLLNDVFKFIEAIQKNKRKNPEREKLLDIIRSKCNWDLTAEPLLKEIAEALVIHMKEQQARAYDKGYTHGRYDEFHHPKYGHWGRPRPEKSRRNPYRRTNGR